MSKPAAIGVMLVSAIASLGFATTANQSSMSAEQFADKANQLFAEGKPVQVERNPINAWLSILFGAVAVGALVVAVNDEQEPETTSPQGESPLQPTVHSPITPTANPHPVQPFQQPQNPHPEAAHPQWAFMQTLEDIKANSTQGSDGQWIKDLVFNELGKPKEQHYSLNGPTRYGKSTLGEALMTLIAGGRRAQVYLINPKHIASKPDWSFPPFCRSIDTALEGLEHCAGLIQERLADASFEPDIAEPIFVVVEEWDWIFAHHGKKALGTLRSIFKVGAGLGVYLFMVGQTAQAQGSGLNGSDFRQFVRLVMGNEAIAFFDNSQYCWSNAAELKPRAEQYFAAGQRFALVIPQSGLPYLEPVPFLRKPAPVKTPTLDDLRGQLQRIYSQGEGLPSELSPEQKAILEVATLTPGRVIKARDVQRAGLAVTNGLSPDEIRAIFKQLSDLEKGYLVGERNSLGFVVELEE